MLSKADFQQIINRIQYKGWSINVSEDANGSGRLFLQVVFWAPCNRTGDLQEQKCRKWTLSPYMTTSEVVGTAYKACLAAEEHECREQFLYRNAQIYGPHIDVEALVGVAYHVDDRQPQ